MQAPQILHPLGGGIQELQDGHKKQRQTSCGKVEPSSGPEFGSTLVSLRSAGASNSGLGFQVWVLQAWGLGLGFTGFDVWA